MTDFQLFNEFDQFEYSVDGVNGVDNEGDIGKTESIEEEKSRQKQKCVHTNTINEKDMILCTDCGEEIIKNMNFEKEWRYYGNSDTKNLSDPSRVQARKNDERNIYKDVENMGFSDKIVNIANDIYTQVTNGQIKRGNSRKAIVFACIFQSFKICGSPQTHDKLIRIFSLNRKTGLQGLKHVALNAPKTSSIHTTHITPEHLVKDVMEKFQATPAQVGEVIDLYNKIKNKDTKLNRARPQSVAAGLTYYWILLNKKDISLKKFTKRVALSELTIGKMAKIISEILGNPELLM